MLHPKIVEHRERLLPVLGDRDERDHALRHRSLQLKGSRARVGDIGNHEAGEAGEAFPDDLHQLTRQWSEGPDRAANATARAGSLSCVVAPIATLVEAHWWVRRENAPVPEIVIIRGRIS